MGRRKQIGGSDFHPRLTERRIATAETCSFQNLPFVRKRTLALCKSRRNASATGMEAEASAGVAI